MNQTDDDLADVTPEPLLRVYLFGPLRVTWQGIPLQGLTRPQLQALWAYLLLVHRHRPVPRERLAFTFWPGGSETQARNSLRQHLYLLRQGLPSLPDSQPGSSPEPVASVPWLLLDPEEIRVNPQAQLWVDVWAFEDGLTRGEAELEAAVQLAGADLLPDLSDDWLTVERERLRLTYNRALTRLVLFKQRQGDRPAALAWAGRLIAHDTWNEEAHCLLIALHHANGDRTAALEQFKECTRILRDEAGVAPSPAALAFREAVLRGKPLPAPWSEFRGPSESIAAQILQEAAAPPQPGLFTLPFVGREAELRHLVKLWHETAAPTRDSGRIVLVGGEAGVGKTRLLAELAERVERSGGQVLWGHCYAFERHVPYQPVVEALRAALPQLAAGAIPLVWLAEAARLIPELREIRPDIPEPPRLDPEQAQARLMEGLYRCLLGLAGRQPLLLLLEDLHWAAVSTLMWLHAISRQVGSAPALIVGSYRQEEVSFGHPLLEWMREIRRQGWGTFLTLNPLAGDSVQTLVNELSGLGESAVGLARRLQTESEGNPFFLSELLQHLQEIGQLRSQKGRWVGPWIESAGMGEEGRLPLPESVREAILSRVDRLSEGGRALLGFAAVAGREFDLKIVQTAMGWGDEQTLDALGKLLERGLLREGVLATNRDHKFNHHLVQETVYETIPQARRQIQHREVGEAMVAVYGEAEAGELAYHFEQARMQEQALKYLKLAGEQAVASYVNAEALDYYARALALLPTEAVEERYDLLAARVDVWLLLGRWEEQRGDLEAMEAAAKVMAEKRSNDSGQSNAVIRLANTYIQWTWFHDAIGDFPASAQAARDAQALFNQAGDLPGEAKSLNVLGKAAVRMADHSTARESLQAAMALFKKLGNRRGEASATFGLGALSSETGDLKSARFYFEQVLGMNRDIGNQSGRAATLAWLGDVNLSLGDYTMARSNFEEALVLARSIEDRWQEAGSLKGLGDVSLRTGEFETAEKYMRQATPHFQAMGYFGATTDELSNLASVAWQLGEDSVARQYWEEALESYRNLGYQILEANTLAFLGNLLCQYGEYESASTHLEQALEFSRQAGFRLTSAMTLYLLGQLHWAEGDPAEAFQKWRAAATQWDELDVTTRAHASRARLAEALVVLNQADEARQLSETVWIAWQTEPPLGEELDEIRQGYLALARTFARLGEPQAARACQEQAHAFVQGRLAHISDEARRQSFVTRVPVNREIEAAYAGLALKV